MRNEGEAPPPHSSVSDLLRLEILDDVVDVPPGPVEPVQRLFQRIALRGSVALGPAGGELNLGHRLVVTRDGNPQVGVLLHDTSSRFVILSAAKDLDG